LQVPLGRWDVDFVEKDTSTLQQRFGAFIEGIQMFDEQLFGVSKTEASFMDPQQRVLLESVYTCLEGIDQISSCSVAVGVSYNEYFMNLLSLDRNPLMATSGTLSVLSGRVSYAFDLKGSAVSIDTACSSSLIGLHVSMTSFMSKEIDKSLSCGVNLLVRPETSWVLSGAAMLSTDGRCKTLDSRGDGYGRAEGCVVHLLRRLNDRDAKMLEYVIVSGTAIGQDGKSSSLTAPNGPAQQSVILSAFSSSGILPDSASALEMHGTGTALGDPIEIGAITAVFRNNARVLRLEAAKATALHAEPAAGAVGLMNLVKGLENKLDLMSFNQLRHMNSYVSRTLDNNIGNRLQLQISRSSQPCINTAGGSFVGSVSSFAFQGSNAHVVVERKSLIASIDQGDTPRFASKAHWWSSTAVLIFDRYHLDSKRTQDAIFSGSISASTSCFLLQDLSGQLHIPAGLILSLATRLVSHLGQSEVDQSLIDVSLEWVAAAPSGTMEVKISKLFGHLRAYTDNGTSQGRVCNAKISKVDRQNGGSSESDVSAAFSIFPSQDANIHCSTVFNVSKDTERFNMNMVMEVLAQLSMNMLGMVIIDSFCYNDLTPIDDVKVANGSLVSNRFALAGGICLMGIQSKTRTHLPESQPRMIASEQQFKKHSKETVVDLVNDVVFQTLSINISESEYHFGDIGIDSISSMELRKALEIRFGVQLPATVVYDYPDTISLSSFILETISSDSVTRVAENIVQSHSNASGAVSIIDISGCLGGSSSRDDGIVKGIQDMKERNSVAPCNRWDDEQQSPLISLGYWIRDLESFDPEIFKISKKESTFLDPQIRILLEAAADCIPLVQSYIGPGKLFGSYIGCVWNEYPKLLEETLSRKEVSSLTGSGLNFSSGRISFSFNLKGPCIGIDTACSSSLVAIHLSCQDLIRGGINKGFSGGTNVMLMPSTSQNLAALGSLSVSGRCKTLDAQADGYGRGEGCASVITSLDQEYVEVMAYIQGMCRLIGQTYN
jgi:3-oxoacyl-(acyl-carrier-protein) synthase/acyl carrier protein